MKLVIYLKKIHNSLNENGILFLGLTDAYVEVPELVKLHSLGFEEVAPLIYKKC